MVFFNYATMQMAAKIVYYGPGLCGKTTNLHHIYSKTTPQSRGEMVSLETETDRTLFFDLLPIDVGVIGGFKTRLQLYTVPGQVFYNTTRKLVLKGVDGIVFVADSQQPMLDANAESLHNLRVNLAEIGLDLDELPVVLQLNKRDLPNAAPVETMLATLDPDGRFEHVPAVASVGTGVFETLKTISKQTLRTLRRRMTGEEPSRAAAASRAATFRVKENTNPIAAIPDAKASAPTPAPVEPPPPESPPPEPAPRLHPTPPPRAMPTFTAPVSPVTVAAVPLPELPPHETATGPVAFDGEETLLQHPPPATSNDAPDVMLDGEEPSTRYVPPPELAAGVEPDVEFGQEEKQPRLEPAVKTVKVRSSVDVMAELEALRKRATQTTPRAPKRDIITDLSSLRPRRDVHRTLNVKLPADVLPRARSVRVTLSFEDGERVIETREEKLDLGETSDVQTLSVNLKIDLA